jgi:PadR family transcriptional regulator, regulatory protein AphA
VEPVLAVYAPNESNNYSWEEHLSRRPEGLTTTSYAILGLLAIRPWSMYELAKQLRRDLHYFWPRAESNLYAEPKRLVDYGYARGTAEPHGKRPRTVYAITQKGRRAVARWLEQPAAPARLESEGLVKLFLAPYGTKETLLEHLRNLRQEAETRKAEMRSIHQPYLEGSGPFPERLHLTVLGASLLLAQAEAQTEWAAWAIAEVERWRDTLAPADPDHFLQLLEQALPQAPSTPSA